MNDKIQHILAGVAVAVIVGLLPYLEHNNLFCGCWSAITSGVIAGAVKEWTDYKHTNVWDWRDFAATIIGGIIVVLLILGLHFGKG